MHLEVEKLQEAKVILSDPETAPQYLPSLPELEWMQLTSAGVEKAIKYITPQQKSSLTLSRCGGVYGPAMVQFVIGHIVSWEREFRKMWQDQQECKWYAEFYNICHQYIVHWLAKGKQLSRISQFVCVCVYCTLYMFVVGLGEGQLSHENVWDFFRN